MKRITVNNITITKKQALRDAAEYHDQTGEPIEVCDTLGDTIAFFKNGRCITY